MATTQRPAAPSTPKSPPSQPAIRVVPDDAAIDVRAWAQQVVAVTLELEGVIVTPTAIAET